ncbi:MAG TPA: hypothetical protein VN668_15665 [Stellaceae bacterium]|nr:hypothetical protein [Stellaceae bacterium]
MAESLEVDVLGVTYVGPHCVEPENYEIVVRVRTTPRLGSDHLTLRFRGAEAAFLAAALQANPPRTRRDDRLMDQVAVHDT